MLQQFFFGTLNGLRIRKINEIPINNANYAVSQEVLEMASMLTWTRLVRDKKLAGV
jgi:hypothetical protein